VAKLKERPLDYIPLHLSIQAHKKTRRLKRMIGHQASVPVYWYVIELFLEIAKQYPDGLLGQLDPEDIADMAQWPGDPDLFLRGLISAEYLTETDDGLVMPTWGKYGGKVIERRVADRERKRKLRSEDDCPADNDVCPADNRVFQRTSSGQSRFPADIQDDCPADNRVFQRTSSGQSRFPADIQRKTRLSNGIPEESAHSKSKSKSKSKRKIKDMSVSDLSLKIQTYWGAYRQHHQRMSATLKSKDSRYSLVKKWLMNGYDVKTLIESMEGFHKSPFHLGENDRATPYLGLKTILRDEDQIEKGLEFYKNPPKRNGSAVKEPNYAWEAPVDE